ncbi:MAG: DUF4149 domain-containing protein [Thermodesulfovibrionales bacterium]
MLALWVGGMALFTFIITPAIFNSYSRDMAGEIVGRLFPGYFLYNLVLSVLALILFLIPWSDIARKGFRLSLFCIVMAVFINIFVCFKLHPEIRVIKKEIHSFETLSSDDPLRMKFRRLHGISSVLNLLLLADGVTLLLAGTTIKK